MEIISSKVHHYSKIFLVLLLSVLSIVIIAQVLSRTFLGFSIVWSEELSRYLLVWLTFIGASIALRNKELVGLDLLETKLSVRLNEVLKLVVHVLVLVFLAYTTYYGIEMATSSGVAGQQSPTMKFSMTYVYLAIPTGTFLMLIHTVAAILEGFRKVGGTAR